MIHGVAVRFTCAAWLSEGVSTQVCTEKVHAVPLNSCRHINERAVVKT